LFEAFDAGVVLGFVGIGFEMGEVVVSGGDDDVGSELLEGV